MFMLGQRLSMFTSGQGIFDESLGQRLSGIELELGQRFSVFASSQRLSDIRLGQRLSSIELELGQKFFDV